MPVSSFEREIIRELFKSYDWFDLYSLHVRFLLSPAQVAYAISKLEGDGLVEIDGTNAKLTAQGRGWVLKNRRDLFLNAKRPWAKSKFEKGEKLKAGKLYMPRLRSIDRAFFEKK